MTARWELEPGASEKAGWLAPFVADMEPGGMRVVKRTDGSIWHLTMEEGFMDAVGSVTATRLVRGEDDAEAEQGATA